jgi:hopanoid biosynthesis associated RND transporter like protein HpnN
LFDRAETIFAAFLTRWVAAVGRRAWLIIVLAVAATVAGGSYTVNNVGVNTDTNDMISEDLDFRKLFKTYQDAFQLFSGPIVVVIDGATPDLADRAANMLAERFEADPGRFEAVRLPGGGPYFAHNGLLYLDIDELYDLSDRLAAAQPLLAELVRDESLRGLFDVLTQAADEIADGDAEAAEDLAPVLDQLVAAIDSELAGGPTYFSWQSVMSGETPDVDDKRRFVMVQPTRDFSQLRPSRPAIKEIRRLAEELGLNPENGVTIRLTGSGALADEELATITNDASRAGLISFALVALILLVGLRSPKLVVASLVTIVSGLVWTATFAVAVVGDFNLISVAFAVLFIGLSVDFSIHYVLRYREALLDGHALPDALAKAAGEVGWPLVLGVTSTVIAFYSFIPTAYAGVSELGLIAGTGMIIALFSTMTVLPAMLTLMPVRPSAIAPTPVGAGLNAFLRRFARSITVAAVVLGVASVFFAMQVRFDFDPVNLRDPSTESVRTFRDLQQNPKTTTYTIKVLEPDLDRAVALAERLDDLNTVKDTITLASYVPEEQDEKLDVIDGMGLLMLPVLEPEADAEPPPDAAAQRAAVAALRIALTRLAASPEAGSLAPPAARLAAALSRLDAQTETSPDVIDRLQGVVLASLPAQIDRLRQSMTAGPVTLEDLPAQIRDQYLATDGRARIVVRPAIDGGDPDALESFVAEVQAVTPNATGGPVMIIESGRAVIDAFILASLIATVLITGLLLLLLGRVGDVLLVLMPLVLAGLLTLATSALIGQAFNFANVIVLPLLLGLAVDGGIHIVMREKTIGAGRTLMQSSTPRAVLLAALTTICSFGSLAISDHRGTASMGLLLTVSLTFTMIATLIVLPAALSLRERRAAQSR